MYRDNSINIMISCDLNRVGGDCLKNGKALIQFSHTTPFSTSTASEAKETPTTTNKNKIETFISQSDKFD